MTNIRDIAGGVLGRCTPDTVGKILGTGFYRFNSPTGIEGLAKWGDHRLDLLAVQATRPGFGQFRDFIVQAKTQFNSIGIWNVFNPTLAKTLVRYGFQYSVDVMEPGEIVEGFLWSK